MKSRYFFLLLLPLCLGCKQDGDTPFFNRDKKDMTKYYYLKNRQHAVLNEKGEVCLHLSDTDSIFLKPSAVKHLHVDPDPNDSEFPIEVYQFTNLKYLWVGKRDFKRIPVGISSLKNLEILDCQHSKVQYVSDDIGELRNLKTLSFLFTDLDTLPNSINRLLQLEELNLGGTPIRKLPESMDQLINLKKLVLFKKSEKERFSKEERKAIEILLPDTEILWE